MHKKNLKSSPNLNIKEDTCGNLNYIELKQYFHETIQSLSKQQSDINQQVKRLRFIFTTYEQKLKYCQAKIQQLQQQYSQIVKINAQNFQNLMYAKKQVHKYKKALAQIRVTQNIQNKNKKQLEKNETLKRDSASEIYKEIQQLIKIKIKKFRDEIQATDSTIQLFTKLESFLNSLNNLVRYQPDRKSYKEEKQKIQQILCFKNNSTKNQKQILQKVQCCTKPVNIEMYKIYDEVSFRKNKSISIGNNSTKSQIPNIQFD